jgi:hypothetical protein
MKLSDLEPRLVRHLTPEGRDGYRYVDTLAEAQGVHFLCPCSEGHGLLVYFRDRGVPDDAVPGPGRWTASGTSLEDLTLTPSISVRCWHGFVIGGQVTTC